MSGTARPYLTARNLQPTLTPMVYFYDSFYSRLFDWIPHIKPLFKNSMHRQGRMLANIVHFIVHNLEEQNKRHFVANLTRLARAHNAIGVTAEHYSVMGMTLVHTVRKCMGDDEFTDMHRHAWVVVYSAMMAVIIPVAVSRAMPEAEEEEEQGRVIRVKPVWHVGESKLSGNEASCPAGHSRPSH